MHGSTFVPVLQYRLGFGKVQTERTKYQASSTIATQLAQFRSGHDIFGRPVAKAAASTMPAYQWWLNFGASVPELQQFTVRRPILRQTARSSEAERNWNLFGFVQNDRRCSRKSQTLEKMVFINANSKHFYVFNVIKF